VFDLFMKMHIGLMLLVALAVLLPGGSLLFPLAYARYRKAARSSRASSPEGGQAR
jgi:hypothetical protein